MKRRVLSFTIALALCLNLFPVEAFAADTGAELNNSSISDNKEYELPENRDLEEPYLVKAPLDMYAKGYTLTGLQSNAITVTGTGKLYLIDNGSIISQKGAGVEVQSGGFLSVVDPGMTIQGSTYALDIASGAEVHLSAGTYSGDIAAIQVADGDYAGLLGEGFAFFDGGNAITLESLAGAKTLTVGQCTDHAKGNYTAVDGSPTHTWTCPYCGTSGTEKCTFSFVQDGDGTGACADCNNGLSITVSENDLSNLVYDGTLQPEEVGVTVTLTDPDGNSTTLARSTEGTQDRDFTVDIVSIKDAGEATVTVTGVTFNGTFVKTYTVEPATPGISWAAAAKDVNYDGQPVEASDLPAVNKQNIVSGDEDSLTLKYQYTTDGTNFTDGLPTDAGTYRVKAYLEGNPNYVAVETDPLLELTINKINPVTVSPLPQRRSITAPPRSWLRQARWIPRRCATA